MRLATLPASEQVAQHIQLGRDFLAQGLLPEAEQEFQTALGVDPNSGAAHAALAQVREQSGATSAAREEAQISNRLSPNAVAFLVLARLDLQASNLAASADSVSKALNLDPRNTAAQALRTTLQTRGQSLP